MLYLILIIMLSVCRGKFLAKYSTHLPKQAKFKNLLTSNDYPIVFGIGPSGTGKTLMATYEAINGFENNMYKKIIITRPAITAGEDLGYLKGDIKDKMLPYIQPILDYFLDYYTKNQIDIMIANNQLEIAPLAYLRGRTFKNSYIIADEIQNSTPTQLKMLLTRIGNNSKIVVLGDTEQSDLGPHNGLVDFLNRINLKNEPYEIYENGFGIVTFDNSYIQRHKIIEKIIEIYS